MKKRISRSIPTVAAIIKNVLALFRWQFWGVSIIPVLIGYYMTPHTLDLARFVILLVIFGPCLEGGAEAINDYFDVETDKPENINKIGIVQLSGGTGLIQNGAFAKPTVLVISLFVYSIGLILAACFFQVPFVITVIIGIFLGIGYSAPPLRFKARGLLGPLSVGISFGCLTIFAGFTVNGILPDTVIILRMLPILLTVTGLFLTHQIVDYKADLNASVRTFCVRHGIRLTRILSSLLILSGIIAVCILLKHSSSERFAAILVLIGLLWILIALFRDRITTLVRIAAVLLEATVGILYMI